ncbi:multidrug efflux RND transporter periplasmic adaptor subunit MexM [Rhodocyclaceae bacterium]
MRRQSIVAGLAVLALGAAGWFWFGQGAAPKPKGAGVVPIVSARVTPQDVSVQLTSNGTVTAVQSVEVRAQISATIRTVHVKEGQHVRQGERLFSLDVRSEEANLGKAQAQLAKSRADLANAERNLQRQNSLFAQKFISQTALDTVQNQADSLRAQVAADQANVAAFQVNRGFGDIVAPIAGRIGAINVFPGSLVQPGGVALVSITQIDPINVSFTLPERELSTLRDAMGKGVLAVTARLENGEETQGELSFIDNSIDTASGTIRLKARFANAGSRLWPGMFVTVALSPRTLVNALTVPVQAVQTGPERKFLYAIGEDNKVTPVPIRVLLVQEGLAVIEGAEQGTKAVVEGAQNLRPGSSVSESVAKGDAKDGEAKKP